MSSIKIVLLAPLCALAVLGTSGCATTRAPSGYLVEDTETQWEVYGGWITLETNGTGPQAVVKGEFIAYQDSNVYVLTETRATVVRCGNIQRAILELHSNETNMLGEWTLLGVLSTASHGLGLIFTFPTWIIVGTASASADSWADHYEQEDPTIDWWLGIKKFSRFPQGIPINVRLDSLRFNRRRLMKG
ncbi:MAG TPA: hypothetical protein VIS48_13460 [Candidatus Kryptonia bacterium]